MNTLYLTNGPKNVITPNYELNNYKEKKVGNFKCTENDTNESMKRAIVSINFYLFHGQS